jgi:hypothetical protein
MTDLSQLPGLPWPLSRVAYRSGGGGAGRGTAAPADAAAADAAAPDVVEAGVSAGRGGDVSVTVDGGRLVVSGGRLDVVLATVQAHLGSDAQLSQCDRSIVGGIGGFFGRERFTVIATPGADGPAPALSDADASDEVASYGAEQYESDQYEAEQYEAEQYEVEQYEAEQYEVEQYEAEPQSTGEVEGGGDWSGPAFAEALSDALADLDAAGPAVLAAQLDPVDRVELTHHAVATMADGPAQDPLVDVTDPVERSAVEPAERVHLEPIPQVPAAQVPTAGRSFAEELLGELFGDDGVARQHDERESARLRSSATTGTAVAGSGAAAAEAMLLALAELDPEDSLAPTMPPAAVAEPVAPVAAARGPLAPAPASLSPAAAPTRAGAPTRVARSLRRPVADATPPSSAPVEAAESRCSPEFADGLVAVLAHLDPSSPAARPARPAGPAPAPNLAEGLVALLAGLDHTIAHDDITGEHADPGRSDSTATDVAPSDVVDRVVLSGPVAGPIADVIAAAVAAERSETVPERSETVSDRSETVSDRSETVSERSETVSERSETVPARSSRSPRGLRPPEDLADATADERAPNVLTPSRAVTTATPASGRPRSGSPPATAAREPERATVAHRSTSRVAHRPNRWNGRDGPAIGPVDPGLRAAVLELDAAFGDGASSARSARVTRWTQLLHAAAPSREPTGADPPPSVSRHPRVADPPHEPAPARPSGRGRRHRTSRLSLVPAGAGGEHPIDATVPSADLAVVGAPRPDDHRSRRKAI